MNPLAHIFRTLLVAVLLLAPAHPSLAEQDECMVPEADDWSLAAAEAREHKEPIVVIFTSRHCGYCDRLKAEVLRPAMLSGEYTDRALLRRFDIGHSGKVVDFDGDRVRARQFVRRYQVFATPTVLFLDDQGKEVAKRIVGVNNIDMYAGYLRDAIEASRAEL